ncbi:MAG: hypothetical protein M5U28_24775 [Sandaracinaceae bacterium]|nr:hypothetical protein [Sandaracinaceae bacterium]
MPTTDERAHTLYAHSRRPTWGLAILAREDREERQYQFQDGQLRTFKRGYYELLEEVEAPPRAVDIVRDLEAMLRIEQGRSAGGRARSTERVVRFDDQVRAFEASFPRGFADPAWTGRAGEGLARARAGAIAEARAHLAASELERALCAGATAGVIEIVKRVLGATDLAGSKDSLPIRRLSADHHEELVRSLAALLWDAGPYAPRLDGFVAALRRASGRRVSWPLATVLPALVHSSAHVAVKPTVFRRQARWMAPSLAYDAAPSGALYAHLKSMAEAVRDRLAQAGHPPRDLLDVHDFMVWTLRPGAIPEPPARG